MNEELPSRKRSHSVERLIFLGKLGFAGLLIYLVFRAVDVNQAIELISSTSVPLFVVVVAGHFALMVTKSLRWKMLCETRGAHIAYGSALKAYVTAFAFGTFTPGQLGDLGKVMLLRLPSASRKLAFAAAIVDRLWDLAGLLIVSALSVAWLFRRSIPSWTMLGLVFGTVLVSLIVLAVLWQFRRSFGKLRRVVEMTLAGWKGALLLTTAAVLVQLVRWGILAVALSQSLLLSVTSATVGSLVALAPVTVAGLGTREATIGYLFLRNGSDSEAGVAFSLLMFTATLMGAAVGALMLLWSRRKTPKLQDSEPS